MWSRAFGHNGGTCEPSRTRIFETMKYNRDANMQARRINPGSAMQIRPLWANLEEVNFASREGYLCVRPTCDPIHRKPYSPNHKTFKPKPLNEAFSLKALNLKTQSPNPQAKST